MRRDYGLGLIVGKFAPLHMGHVLVVQRAASLCEQIAIISYSNPELPGYRAELREAWLKACFPDALRVVVTAERLASWLSGSDVPTIPANDAPDCDHREFVALICRRILRRPVDAVFTSEAYGDGFAAHLTRSFRATRFSSRTVRHIMVDRERRTVPISGTELRRNLWRHWDYVPAPVAHTLVQRIVFLGGESSGKTMLASRLAKELSTEWTPEYGRELWEAKGGCLSYEDLSLIAREQIRREESAVHRARAFLFCDTSPLTTLFYRLGYFWRCRR